ncbi:MAG: ABC transporter transmembrane domain-containing protein, partial [Planctomycetota bacterium]
MSPPAKDDYEGRGRFAGGLLPRLLAYAWPQSLLLGISLVLFPLAAVAQLGQPYVLKLVLDGPIKEGDVDGILPYVLVFIGLVLGHGVLQFTQNVLMTLAGQRIMRTIRGDLFRRVLRLPPAFFDRTPTGKVLTRLTGDVENLNEFVSSGLVTVVADTVLLIGIVGSMLWLNWKLALISFVLVPPFLFVLSRMRGYMRQLFRALRNRSTALNTFLNENVVGMLVVQAFRREAKNDATHEELTVSLYDESMRALKFSSVLSAGVQLAETLTLALLLWAALGGLLTEAAVSAGLLVAFVDYVGRFYAPIENLSGRYTILQNALASAEKIFTLMDEPDELPDPATPAALAPLAQSLKLEDVTFRYQTGEVVLDHVTLDVPKGQTVALVGATGAGKSTVVKLLGRFYDPNDGQVTWDGTDLRAFEANALR